MKVLFSIVIPTYSRPEQLSRCITSLKQLDYEIDEFEVIVIDDGSPESVEPVVERFQDQLNIHLLRQGNAGPATARNTGAAHAKGKYIIFTDDDCMLAPDYLRRLSLHIQREPDVMIGGRTVNVLENNICATVSQLLIDYLYGYFNIDPEKLTLFTSNNLVVPSRQFKALGGFDIGFPSAASEDREFCDRWQRKDRPISYAPDLKVYHAHDMNLSGFVRQHFNYGVGAFYYHQLRSREGLEPIRPGPFSFYLNMLLFPLKRRKGLRAPVYMVLLFVSQLANAMGFIYMLKSKKRIQ